ncbi:MAG TPA: hypothetical protein VIN09_09305 [Chloroflexota bacterium]
MARGDAEYVKQLGAVLRQRDVVALRTFLLASARRFGDERQVAEIEAKSDAELEETMHRMILARPDLKDLHAASRRWLAQRGR